jgi:hypothetical protein
MDSRNLGRFEPIRMSELPPTSRLEIGMISFGRANIECHVRALSAFGATLAVPSPMRIPDEFVLRAHPGQKSYACNVVKRSGISSALFLSRPSPAAPECPILCLAKVPISFCFSKTFTHVIGAPKRGTRRSRKTAATVLSLGSNLRHSGGSPN